MNYAPTIYHWVDEALLFAVAALYLRLTYRMVRRTHRWDLLSRALVFQFSVMGAVWLFAATSMWLYPALGMTWFGVVRWTLRVAIVACLVTTNMALSRDDEE